MRSNYIYYITIIVLCLVIIFKYGISTSYIEVLDNADSKKCKSYIGINHKKLNIQWQISTGYQAIYVKKLIPERGDPNIQWKAYNEDGNIIYEEIVKHSWGVREDRDYNKRLTPHRLNFLYSKSLEPDILNSIVAVELYEVEMGCSVYETDAEQKVRYAKNKKNNASDKKREIIKNNCIIKNTHVDSDDYYTERKIRDFCDLISEDPSLFQYINYYYF